MPSIFIAGTDTGVGKTWVTGHLAKHINDIEKNQVVTQKWIQTGSIEFSDDVREHWRIMGCSETAFLPFKKAIVPYSFPLEASPHLAAQNEGKIIESNRILAAYSALKQKYVWVVVEGSGGIMTPYTREATLVDVLEHVKIPVLLVAANRLGAINHTLLSLEALKVRRIPLVGVFLNTIGDESLVTKDNGEIIQDLCKVKVFKPGEWDEILRRLPTVSG